MGTRIGATQILSFGREFLFCFFFPVLFWNQEPSASRPPLAQRANPGTFLPWLVVQVAAQHLRCLLSTRTAVWGLVSWALLILKTYEGSEQSIMKGD